MQIYLPNKRSSSSSSSSSSSPLKKCMHGMLFADDTSLFHIHEHIESLIKETNQELTRISTWLATNKVVLNIS